MNVLEYISKVSGIKFEEDDIKKCNTISECDHWECQHSFDCGKTSEEVETCMVYMGI